jgi:hypothetical protein
MSHLLYLYSFPSHRVTRLFGSGDTSRVDRLFALTGLERVMPPAKKTKFKALIARTIEEGLREWPSRQEDRRLLETVVERGICERSFGVGAVPLTHLGAPRELMFAYADAFAAAGPIAQKLYDILLKGANWEGGAGILSPDDVQIAVPTLKKVVLGRDSYSDGFDAEVVEPFEKAAQRRHGIVSCWG